jgi:ankyrin repeat protein
MKSQLIAIVAAVLLVGCGESQQSAPAPEAKPVEPIAEVPAQPSAPPAAVEPPEPIAEAAKPTAPPKVVSANKGADPARGVKAEPPTAKTPDISIHDAVGTGNIEAVKEHLAAGTDRDEFDNFERTPLTFSAEYGRKEIAELLIAEGADVNAKSDESGTPLYRAALKGHKEIVEMLIAAGADVNAKYEDEGTPLHMAALNGHKEIVELLIAKGADVNAKTRHGQTPLDLAIKRNPETADLLRKHGGKTGEELKAEGK